MYYNYKLPRLVFFAAMFTAVPLLLATATIAHPGHHGAHPHGNTIYDTNTVEEFRGVIVQVTLVQKEQHRRGGVHLKVKTEKETLTVHAGPVRYLQRIDCEFQKDEKLYVKGSRVTIEGETVIIAAEIRRAQQVCLLRDEAGYPMWSRRN